MDVFTFETKTAIFPGGPTATYTGLCKAQYHETKHSYDFTGFKVIPETVRCNGEPMPQNTEAYIFSRIGSAIRENNTAQYVRPISEYIALAKQGADGPVVIEVSQKPPSNAREISIETLSFL